MSGPRRPSSPRTTSRRSNRTWLVVGGVVAVVVVAAVVALLVSGGDDSSAGGATDGTELEVIAENQAVDVIGTPLPPLAQGVPDAAVGTAAPGLVGQSFYDTPVEVTPGNGSPYLLVFLAHWCPHCQAEVPVLVRWNEEGGVPDGLQVVAVSTAVSEERPNYPPSEWLDEEGWPWPALADDELATAAGAYGVSGFPFLVVVDAEGNVAGRTSGEKSIEELTAFVTQSLGA
jgi:thiol-disulfide isomerase/thioredoxin